MPTRVPVWEFKRSTRRRNACLREPALMVGVILVIVTGLSLNGKAATNLPTLWTAGGLSAGSDSAGQAARVAADSSGNVAIVSGPSDGRDLAVTSYTTDGTLRWQSTITPSIGVFIGDWVVAAPNGDFIAIGHNVNSRGQSIASTMNQGRNRNEEKPPSPRWEYSQAARANTSN